MTGMDAYKIWAPPECKWTPWVRPVPFVCKCLENINQVMDYTTPEVYYLNKLQEDLAIILDLPGYESVNEGIALAGLGWRPIPLFNGTNEQEGTTPLVDNHCIEAALLWESKKLEKINLKKNAPPAFLLDSNRLHRHKVSNSYFDNSWDVYAQDLPTAEYFYENGIKRILIRGEKIFKDLKRILYGFQKKGLKILFTEGYDEAKEVKINRWGRK